MRHNFQVTIGFGDEDDQGNETQYVADCEVSPYDPGRTSGPPEDCYPPEGGDVTIGEVRRVDYIEPSSWRTFIAWLRGHKIKPRIMEVDIPEDMQSILIDRHGCQIEEGAINLAQEAEIDEMAYDDDY
jgi:hypothetical protein